MCEEENEVWSVLISFYLLFSFFLSSFSTSTRVCLRVPLISMWRAVEGGSGRFDSRVWLSVASSAVCFLFQSPLNWSVRIECKILCQTPLPQKLWRSLLGAIFYFFDPPFEFPAGKLGMTRAGEFSATLTTGACASTAANGRCKKKKNRSDSISYFF